MMQVKTRSLKIILIAIAMIFAIAQVVMSNRESTVGEELQIILTHIEEIEKGNSTLATQIASASSIATISSKAAKWGYDSNVSIVTLTSPLPLASLEQQTL